MKNRPRFQEIKFSLNGDAFVVYNQRRHYLSTFMRLESPLTVYAPNKKEPIINANGYKQMSNCGGLYIEINKTGEAAKVCNY